VCVASVCVCMRVYEESGGHNYCVSKSKNAPLSITPGFPC